MSKSVVLGLALATLSAGLPATGAETGATGGLAHFSIKVKPTGDGLEATCEAGCAWKSLTFNCEGDTTSCLAVIDETGIRSFFVGSIPVIGELNWAQLAQRSKLSRQAAVKIALEATPSATTGEKKVLEAGLEVERGYLVWSVEILVPGETAAHRFLVDAGTGTILGRGRKQNSEPKQP